MGGWIALYRDVREHWIWNTSPQRFQRWVDLLFQAAWERKQTGFGNVTVTLERGQIATSTRRLMRQWGANNTTVSTTLQLFEQNGMITVKRVKNMTIITIVNYDKYQKATKIAETLSRIDLENTTDADTVKVLLNAALGNEEERLSVQNQIPIEQEKNNNIITKQVPSSSSIREENLKFAKDFKENDSEIEEAMMLLRCDKNRILKMIDDFVIEQNLTLKKNDSPGNFRSHFINWARIHLRKNKENGKGRQKTKPGGVDGAEDKYAARRGTDVGDHTAKDYGGSF